MARNRLNLNFQLESAADRNEYVQQYLSKIDFVPNEKELETISNYILWGKNEKGLNAQQEGAVELKRWTAAPVESLEALLETPGFSETSFKTLKAPGTRIPRQVFSREKALAGAPDYLKPYYEDLFRQIDTIELMLNFYELFTGKRKLPPREKLLEKFSEEEQKVLNEKALRLSQYKYLKLKHQLVELRSEQYTYQDTHQDKILTHTGSIEPILQEEKIWIGEDIQVWPLGLIGHIGVRAKMFADPKPGDFTDDELREVSEILSVPKAAEGKVLDFTDESHVLNLYNMRADLRDEQDEDPFRIYGAASAIVETLQYYEQRANLTELQKDLLEMKLKFKQNSDIASYINKTYNKSYNDNYISTIFHQKIIPQIANAAREHREIMENIFYPENFKKCKDCGRVYLLNSDNFVKQKKSNDGFSPRCKSCEKLKRSKYK